MYEKCIKNELEDRRRSAVTMANANMYASPSYDRSAARSKERIWQQFMDSLDWDKLTNLKKKQSPEEIKRAFKSLKIPIVGEKKKEGVNK